MRTRTEDTGKKVKNSYRKGVDSEELVKKFLQRQNYEIIASRFKRQTGEIDLIALKENCLVFCEIKQRGRKLREDIVSAMQKRRIMQTAEVFLSENSQYIQADLRFDFIFVDDSTESPYKKITHIKNAWTEDEIF